MNRRGLIIFGDFIAFWVSFVLLIFIRFEAKDYSLAVHSHLVPFIILYVTWVLVFYVFGLYDLITIKPTIPYLRRWIVALVCSLVLGIILFYLVPIFGIAPKVNLAIQFIEFAILSFFFRRMIYRLYSKTITQPTILIGNSHYLKILENNIQGNPQIGLKIIKHIQTLSELDLSKENTKDLIIILDKDIETPNQNILNLYNNGISIIDTAKAYEKYLYKIPVEYIDISFIIENINPNKDTFYKLATTTINVFFSIVVLIIAFPFLVIAGLFIYLYDRGPVFYTHTRIGLNGKVFKLYKLRSMSTDAEKNGAQWTAENDPRITPVGKVIRKLHIDEVPQMINILKGDLSLVGPRPERPEFVELLNREIPYYSYRHIIKPGFTGWAQIKYQYANTTEESKEKFEYDLYYIKNRNVFIDFGIILRTIQIIFTH